MSIPSSGSSTARSASITSSRVGIAASVVTRPRDSAGHEAPDGSRVVLADSRQSRELPFLQTMLCLWGAGSAVGSFAQLAAFAMLRGGSSAALGLSFLPGVLGALVSYSLLSSAARAEAPVQPLQLAPLEVAPPAPPANRYAELSTAIRES